MDRTSSGGRPSVAAGVADANTTTSNRGTARKGIVRIGVISAAVVAIVGAAGVSYANPHLFKTSKPAAVTPASPASPATTPASTVASVPAASPGVAAPNPEVSTPAPVASQAADTQAQNRSGAGSNGQRRSSQNGQSYTWSGPEESTGSYGPSEDLSGPAPQAPSNSNSGMTIDQGTINKNIDDANKKYLDDLKNQPAGSYDPSQNCGNTCGG